MKKMSKIISFMLVIMMLFSITTIVFADGENTPITPSSITGSSSSVNVSNVSSIGNDIVKIITTIGIVASVIVLVVLGIKYMMGSAEEKAEYKKTLMPYVIGAAMVFAASAIANMIYTFAIGIGTSAT